MASQYGGTSASTPLWASVNVLLDELTSSKSGSLNGALYSIGTNRNVEGENFVYHTISSGADGLYSVTPYWNFCTGWGSADFTKLYYDLDTYPNYLPYNPGANGQGGTWTSPIMIHSLSTSPTEPSTFESTTNYFIGVCIADIAPADAVACSNTLKIDGVGYPFTLGPFPAGAFFSTENYVQAVFSPGTHTIQLVANTSGKKESNTGDDIYTRTITVATSSAVLAITINPFVVTGGAVATGTVTFASAAPAGGATVTLSSSALANATPATTTVKVAAGQKTANFSINTANISGSTITATITAKYGGGTGSALLTINSSPVPPTLSSITVKPLIVVSGEPTIGTITLSSAAINNTTNISLTSNKPSNVILSSSSVTVPSGATTTTFNISTVNNTTSPITAIITATYNGVTKYCDVTVEP